MTKQELIAGLEDYIKTIQGDLLVSQSALVALRRGTDVRKGPIVYGNGHHDGKKAKRIIRVSSQPGVRRDKVLAILKTHPQGMTVADLGKAAKLNTMAVHNALRTLRMNGQLTVTKAGINTQKRYALKKGDEKTGVKKSTLTKPLRMKPRKKRKTSPEGEAARLAGYRAWQKRQKAGVKAQSVAA